MTSEMRIKQAILADLKDANPYLIPEETLFADTNMRLGGAGVVTRTQFRNCLHELENSRRVVSHVDEDKITKWKITDNGLARLSELNA